MAARTEPATMLRDARATASHELLSMTGVFVARGEELLPLHRLPRRLHPRGDVLGVPAGEPGQVRRLLAEARRQRGAIGRGRRAARRAAPGMAQHVAALEILAVA